MYNNLINLINFFLFKIEGGCGYGEYGRTINDGNVAVVTSSKLYKGGASCGACYNVKCKEAVCDDGGVVVMVTDYGASDGETDFILSTHAFNKMALPNYEKDLRDYGKVEIEYQRVACKFPRKTLTVKVVEHSRFPSYLAFEFLYQSGDADITAVELFEVIFFFTCIVFCFQFSVSISFDINFFFPFGIFFCVMWNKTVSLFILQKIVPLTTENPVAKTQ